MRNAVGRRGSKPQPATGHPCQSAFEAGRLQRSRHPLQAGDYKLRDAEDGLRRGLETVTRAMADRTVGGGRPRCFGCCTSDELGVWLKRQPGYIAEVLGRDVLPGVAALGGDGLAAADVATELQAATLSARVLMVELMAAHDLLQQGSGPERARMTQGQSTLQPLFEHALSIVRDARATVA